MKSLLIFTGIGFELVGLIVAAVYIGEYLEGRYPWAPWGVAGAVLIALASWLIHLIFLLIALDRNSDNS